MNFNFSENDFLKNRLLIIFGASDGGTILYEYLIKSNFYPTYFGDNDAAKWGTEHCGLKVISPDQIPEDSLVLIASNWAQEIATQLNFMNIQNVDLTCWDDRWRLNFDVSRLDSGKAGQQIARTLFRDEESIKVWDAYIRYRYTADASVLIPSKYNFYGHPKVSAIDGDVVFDVGSYDGKTAKFFLDSGAKKVFTFEPDSENFDTVSQNIKDWGAKNIIVVNKGFWHENASLSFTQDPLYDSQKRVTKPGGVAPETSSTIEVTTIDGFVEEIGETPTLIKMDIEGAEINALRGASDLIRYEQPKLQISVYHEWDDLWRVPQLIHDLNPNYEFFL